MLYISGGNTEQRNILQHALEWYASRHLNRYKKYEIYVKLKVMKEVFAYCHNCGDRKFLLEVHKKTCNYELVATLFHELTHVKQYISGRLKDAPNHTKWEKEKYDLELSYHSSPWEIEAMESEVTLTEEFFDFILNEA